VQSFVKNKDKE